MDYDFQQPQKSEANGYVGKFRFADDDVRKKRTVSKKKERTKTDYLIRLLLLQSVLCALAVAAVFAVSKISPSAFEKMKEDYAAIMQKDMSVSEMARQIKNAASYVFESVEVSRVNVENVSVASEPKKEKLSLESFNVVSDETGETVAVGEMVQSGSGGEDLQGKEAAKGTSFAPYFVSVDPVLPVKNAKITSRFGYRTNPISGNYGFHTGLDLAASEGTPVSAVFYGKVAEIGTSDVGGNYVLMEHSETLQTYYCHLSEIYVEQGAVIRHGETVGLVGSTGWSTGPHLHFEVRINGIRVDPEPLLYPENADEA